MEVPVGKTAHFPNALFLLGGWVPCTSAGGGLYLYRLGMRGAVSGVVEGVFVPGSGSVGGVELCKMRYLYISGITTRSGGQFTGLST